jgi:hypothetical protein
MVARATGNIRIVSFETTGIPELQRGTYDYLKALSTKDKKSADEIQRRLEESFARITNSKLAQGKLGKKVASDLILSPNSSLLEFIRDKTPDSRPQIFAELKAAAGASKGTKIGQLTIGDRASSLFVQGEEEGFTERSVKEKILGRNVKEGYLVDLDTDLKSTNVTDRVFNFYFKKDPRLKRIFYEKASIMLLNNAYNLSGVKRTRLIGLQIPFNKFNSNFFKASIEDKAIVLFINDRFQKELFTQINNVYLKRMSNTKVTKKVKIGSTSVSLDFFPAQDGSQIFGAEVVSSIRTQPNNATRVILPPEIIKPSIDEEREDRLKRESIIDITVLVKSKVKQKMRRGRGKPRPTKIYERSGTFRNSIKAYFNFRQRTVDYFYEPYYQRLERSGYEIGELVEDSIRSVVQAKFRQQVETTRIEL